jgi:hypothetical protein
VAIAEQPLEHRAGIALHRQRPVRRPPAESARVGAAEAGVARTGECRRSEPDFQRRQLGLVSKVRRGNLVERGAGLEVSALGRLGVHAREPGAADPPVSSRGLSRQLRSRFVIESRDDDQLVAVRLQWSKNRGERETGVAADRCPLLHDRAVWHIDHAKPERRPSRGLLHGRERRHHPIEQRQREGRPEPTQNRTARQGPSDNDHGSLLLI